MATSAADIRKDAAGDHFVLKDGRRYGPMSERAAVYLAGELDAGAEPRFVSVDQNEQYRLQSKPIRVRGSRRARRHRRSRARG